MKIANTIYRLGTGFYLTNQMNYIKWWKENNYAALEKVKHSKQQHISNIVYMDCVFLKRKLFNMTVFCRKPQ